LVLGFNENEMFYTQKMLGCLNPTLGQKWTNPSNGLHFLITFLTQRLGLSRFDPKLGLKQPSIFRV